MMDDETLESIASLLGETRVRRASTKTRRTRYAPAEEPYKSPYSPSGMPPRPAPTRESNPTTVNVDLKLEVATLSVDTSMACIVLNAPMTNTIVNRIREHIPQTQRKYDPVKEVWYITPAAMPILKPILKDTYKDVQTIGVPKAIPATKFDQLMNRLDKEDRSKIYRLLAMKYHTDKGGSHETMALINQVFKEGR